MANRGGVFVCQAGDLDGGKCLSLFVKEGGNTSSGLVTPGLTTFSYFVGQIVDEDVSVDDVTEKIESFEDEVRPDVLKMTQ